VVAWAGTGLDVAMVARSASPPGGFSPVASPRVSVAADGTLAAVHEPSHVTLLELPSGAAFAVIGVDPEALANEVAWVGTPPRLLVLSRYAAHSTAHLLDPYGPRTIAEILLEAPMRLFATVGAAALVVGAQSAAVLAASESHLMPYQFPARIMPVAGGAAAGQFVVALAGSIEEWDPQSRMPKRRFRLPRTAAITAVGGSERVVWMTTQQEPARIDVIPLVNRGQPKAHDLPEPIARIAGHPRSDLVACVGADSGRLYIVDLDGRTRLRVIGPSGIARIESATLIVGRMLGVLAAQAKHPIAIVPLDGRDLDLEPASSTAVATAVLPRAEPVKPTLMGAADESNERDIREEPAERGAEPLAEPLVERGPEHVGHSPEPAERRLDPPAERRSEPSAQRRSEPAERGSQPTERRPEPPADRGPEPAERGPEPAERRPEPPAATLSSPRFDLPASTPQASPPPLRPSPPQAPAPPELAVKLVASATPVMSVFRPPAPVPGPAKTAAPAAVKPVPSTSERFSAWRDLVRQNQPRVDPIALTPSPAGSPSRTDARQSWRDEIAVWSRAVSSGAVDGSAPTAPAIDAVLARFDLALQLRPVLVLLYGAHLCGERGVAPFDVARLLDRQWDEALGRGELAERGVAEYAGSRVALTPLILRVLDELPPLTGTLVGEPGPVALLGPCVVVAGDEPLTAIAEQCLSRVGGAILSAHGEPGRANLFFEARAYGAVPMLRVAVSLDAAPSEPAILVVDDEAHADRLGLPRLA
jgi:hypothetical protein